MGGRFFKRLSVASVVLSAFALPVCAGEAEVIEVKAQNTGANIWTFQVTVLHADSGWDHYADKWQVLAPDGSVLGERILLHPHENEQPFTRSLSGVKIAPEITKVRVRAHDSVHGFGGAEIVAPLRSQ